MDPVSDIPASNPEGLVLFEGMDDIFGTYLDPNYPLNLDDFSFHEADLA